MNRNAESFQRYLDEKGITIFDAEELHDVQNTTVFRSYLSVEGQQLPVLVITDNSVFAQVRVQIALNILTDENKTALLEVANKTNWQYKPFKLYFDRNGHLFLDMCLTILDDLNGEEVYLAFKAINNYLNENYRELMRLIWM